MNRKKLEKKLIEKYHKEIPKRFINASLRNSPLKIQEYFLTKRYLEKGLFLFGECGTGKTYDVYALTKYFIALDYEAAVFNLPKLLNIIRASYRKQSIYNEETDSYSSSFVHDVKDIKELVKLEILTIDDIGAEKPTDWVMETLYDLINERYEECKITIFTSNLSLDELAERLGDRIPSRIAEMCEIIELKGEDKRLNN